MTLELIGELTFMDTHNIKPNFSGLSRKYGIDRQKTKESPLLKETRILI